MATIKMDPQLAINYGNQIIQNANSYNKEISNIYEIVDVLKTTWTGTAAQRFVDEIDSFKGEYKKFGQLIDDFGDLLVAIGKDYQKLEDEL